MSVRYPGAAASRKARGRAGRMPSRRGVHRGVDQRPGGGGCVVVAVQQVRRPGQVLDHLPVPAPGGGLGQPRIPRPLQLSQLLAGERGGHRDVVAGQQLAGLGVRVRALLAGGRSAHPRTPATAWPAPAPGPGPGRAAAPATRRPPARPCRRRCRGSAGPRSATPRSAARHRAARPAPPAGRSDATAATPAPGRAAAPAPASTPASCRSTTRPPAPRSRSSRRPPPSPPPPGRRHGRAARTPAAPAAPAAGRRARPGGAPPARTGQSPRPAATPPAATPLPGGASASRTSAASWASMPSIRCPCRWVSS